MPNPSLEDALKEAYASAPSNQVILDTLEIRQVGVQETIFIVKAPVQLVALDEDGVQRVFQPMGFQMSLPEESEEGFRSLNIAVDNIDRRIGDFVQAAKSDSTAVEVIYRPYLSDDLSAPQMNPPLRLFLKEIQITDFQVTGKATFMDLVNQKFPSELYHRMRFPSLR